MKSLLNNLRTLSGFTPLLLLSALSADEGMWTLDNPPNRLMQEHYGFQVSEDWLQHVQLAALRMGTGGSGSFVSSEGLVLTNHHIVVNNLQELSNAENDYVANGFYARTREEERRCLGFELYQLRSFENVTEQITQAIAKRASEEKAEEAKRAAVSQLASEQSEKFGLRCEVVELYQGGEYWLYRYQVYSDVRMVFAPESSSGFYGGDYDNFTFPRHCLDYAFVRVYEDGEPLKTEKWFSWSKKGAAEGELIFVTGHPGSTERGRTLAQLSFEREFSLPFQESRMVKKVAAINNYQARGEEEKRRGHDTRFGTGNYLKRLGGLKRGLQSADLFSRKESEEKELRQQLASNPDLHQQYGEAWRNIEDAYAKKKQRWKEDLFALEWKYRAGQMMRWAEEMTRYVAEVEKESEERLEAYADARLPRVKQQLLADIPVYADLDEMLLAHYLEELVEYLGADSALVTDLLEGKSSAEVAQAAIQGTRIGELAFRESLIAQSSAELQASADPLLKLAHIFDRHYRKAYAWNQENIWIVETLEGAKIAKARFALYGKETYPDASSSLRLSYGKPAGYEFGTTLVPYKTVMGGLYARHDSLDGQEPFQLSEQVLAARTNVDLSVPLNFVTTHDITGGNSGSPVINRDLEVVGVIFDSNIYGVSNDYVYSDDVARAISVHSDGILEGLSSIYQMDELVKELKR